MIYLEPIVKDQYSNLKCLADGNIFTKKMKELNDQSSNNDICGLLSLAALVATLALTIFFGPTSVTLAYTFGICALISLTTFSYFAVISKDLAAKKQHETTQNLAVIFKALGDYLHEQRQKRETEAVQQFNAKTSYEKIKKSQEDSYHDMRVCADRISKMRTEELPYYSRLFANLRIGVEYCVSEFSRKEKLEEYLNPFEYLQMRAKDFLKPNRSEDSYINLLSKDVWSEGMSHLADKVYGVLAERTVKSHSKS